jgi:arylsulfatase A-like enzyme/peptidoglycan/xylan/chitin deacetylase (PgdA/CDA1 family)
MIVSALVLGSAAATAAAGTATLHVPVLMYHRIAPAPPHTRLPQLWVSPRLFRAQMRLLAARGWRTITAAELARAAISGRTVGPKRFVITIDDGARDGYAHAAPILEDLGMRATFCVVPGRTGRPWQLTVAQLVRLHASGHEIANHSLTHADLPAIGAAALRREIAHAARRIERFVGERPATLCFPFGHHDARVRRVVARTGHLAAFTTVEAVAQSPAMRFRWPRVRVSASTSPAELVSRLRPYARGGGAEPRRFTPAAGVSRLAATLPAPPSHPASPPPRLGGPAGDSPTKPNIVVLMLDDVGADDGRLWQRLPAIRERFIENGLAFTDFHGETPTCCPGRVGFLTGLHTDAHGVTRNDGRLFKPSMSLATQLRRRGYHTILAGKYLNAYPSVRPRVPPGWSEFHAMDPGFYGYPMWSNGRRHWYGHRPSNYSTDVITRKLLGSLERAPRGHPVFVWAAPWAAHMPRTPARRHRDDPRCEGLPRWVPPGYMERDVRDKPAYVRRQPRRALRGMSYTTICRSLLSVDDLLRRVSAKLEAQGRLDDTLFILTSDNGMNYGMHRLLLDKKTPYATQLPFFVSWPDRIGIDRPPVRARLQNIDLAPTLCDLAGCTLGPYPTGQRRPDGRSFLGLLLGQGGGPRRPAVLSSFRTPGASVPRWYGATTTASSPLAALGCVLASTSGCRWSYTRYETGEVELYDVSNGPCWAWQAGDPGDPCRLANLAHDHRFDDIEAALGRQLAALRRR